jgi:DNA-binding transcriptional LysR family regulator
MEANGANLRSALSSGAIDLALLTPDAADDFEQKVIARQELPLVVPAGHPLAGRRQVPLRAFAKDAFVSYKSGRKLRVMTEEFCNRAGFVPNVVLEVNAPMSICGFVAAGFGVGLVPPQSVPFPGVSAVRVIAPFAERTIVMMSRKERYLPAAARAFREFVSKNARVRGDSTTWPHLRTGAGALRRGRKYG